MAEAKDIPPGASSDVANPRQTGFIAFCETNLRYEKGRKAWLTLGPYFLGAYIWYKTINEGGTEPQKNILPWLGFLAYLVLFPSIWKWVLSLLGTKRNQTSGPSDQLASNIQSSSQVDENPQKPIE